MINDMIKVFLYGSPCCFSCCCCWGLPLSFRFFLLTRAHVNQDSHSPGMIAATGGAPAPGVKADFWGLWVPFLSICDVRKWEVMTDDVSLPFPNTRQQQ